MNEQSYLTQIVKIALLEDIGSGDVSANLLPRDKIVNAQVISYDEAIICGLDYFDEVFRQLDNNIVIDWQINAGQKVGRGDCLCYIKGQANIIITAERTALNFLQILSATATKTQILVDKIKHTNAQLLDTRKTIPNLRLAQKQAVICGGGVNHRMGLYDCVLIKENHLTALGSIELAMKKSYEQYPNLPMIIEIEDLRQLSEVLSSPIIPMRILCDNFSPEVLTKAVTMVDGKIPLEASGNITTDNILSYAQTGVDCISSSSMTKNITAIDLSLRFIE